MLVATEPNTAAMSKQILAHAGYAGETNLYLLDKLTIDGYVAFDKGKHTRHEPPPRGRIPKAAGLRERTPRKTRTKTGSPSLRSPQACRGTGLRLHQTGARLPSVPALRAGQGSRRMGVVKLTYNLRRLHASGRRQVLMAT